MENYGLPNYDEYGSIRPDGYDPGMQYNAWLEYTWDTALEFCQMILESESYANQNISEYIPLYSLPLISLMSIIVIWRGRVVSRNWMEAGNWLFIRVRELRHSKWRIIPLRQLQDWKRWLVSHLLSEKHNEDSLLLKKDTTLLKSIPDISFREVNGHQVLSPAVTWARVNNTEPTELYPYSRGEYMAWKTWPQDSTRYISLWSACTGFRSHGMETGQYMGSRPWTNGWGCTTGKT